MSAGTDYQYDAFGNLTGRSAFAGSAYQGSFTPDANNQDSTSPYDAAGDLLNDGVNSYSYDAEGRITSVSGATAYQYDAEGRRVAVGPVGQMPTTDYLYDLGGTLVTSVGSDFKMVRSSLYVAGSHWADYTQGTGSGGGRTQYRLGDEVGTLVYTFDQNGNPLEQCLSGPFGEALQCSPSVDYTETHFADKKRDQESNLDYMGARFYSSTLGRFMSPDPSGLYYANPGNPQSLNLYSYALNNPLRRVDPSGLTSCFYGGAGDTPENDNDASDYEDTGTDQNCLNNGGKVLSENASVDVNADYSGDITITADGGSSSTLIQRIQICPGQGNAPSTQDYQAAGSTVAFDLSSDDLALRAVGYAQNVENLYQFRPGGTFDAQKYNGGPDGAVVTQYGNYSYGEYMGAAGYSLQQAMDGATLAASIPPGKYSGQPDPFFAINSGGLRLPQRSVQPITAGYSAGRAGNTACPTF